MRHGLLPSGILHLLTPASSCSYFNSIAGNVCYSHSLPPRFLWTNDQQRQYYPGGWPRGVNGGQPACSTWGKTNLPWSDAMGAVFISGFFYLFFTFTVSF